MAYTSITLILNPASGSGTHQPGIRRAARARQIDVREVRAGYGAGALARDAVHEGAQVPVTAGGDGTFSAVAGVAVEHDVPLVVVPCGMRNHFAKDCGAAITDPAGQLAAIEEVTWCASTSGRSTAGCFCGEGHEYLSTDQLSPPSPAMSEARYRARSKQGVSGGSADRPAPHQQRDHRAWRGRDPGALSSPSSTGELSADGRTAPLSSSGTVELLTGPMIHAVAPDRPWKPWSY